MLKKTLILKHNLFPNLKTKEDYVLWLKISKSGILLDGIKKSLTIWTDRKNSLSKSTFQKIKDGFKVYYKYEKFNFLDSLFRVFILSINFLRKK
jgi:teichuronic acid biosynthesis glycosyltransferase TuaG